MLLKNKVVIITGCNRGIGRAILELFAENGASIYANARKDGSLDEITQELSEKYSVQIVPIYFDVTDAAAIKNCFARIQKEKGRLDVLVNNAGIMHDALIGMIDNKLINDVFATNVFSAINMTQYAARFMSRQGSGSIINMASIVGIEGSAGQAVYSASKGAIVALTKSSSKELCPKGIRVNAIAPGMIDTDILHSIGKEKMTKNISQIGMGRLGLPIEIAKAALFLASDLSSYITGQVLGVNGGIII